MAIIQNFSLSVLGCVFICHRCWVIIKEPLLSFHINLGLFFLSISFSPSIPWPRGRGSGLLLPQAQVGVIITPQAKTAFVSGLPSLRTLFLPQLESCH